MDDGAIKVRGARVHNLRDLDVDIPRDKLVVLTGVSGSGKSSLAYDTIFAEGQRRYVEGLSTFARQFLDQLEPPDVDGIDGLPPTVAIDQRSGSGSPRSTVGTLTEINDYLRLMYARVGLPHCPKCGRPIRRQTAEQMVQSVMALGEGKKAIVLAPLVRGRKGVHADSFALIRREGLIRARVDGETIEVGDPPPKLAKGKLHTIEAVIDRLVVREGMRARLAESLDRALKLGDGTVTLSEADDSGEWVDRTLSVNFACPECGVGLAEVEPRTFSFNSPYGACPECSGLGTARAFDPDLVVPDRSRPIGEAVPAVVRELALRVAAEAKVDLGQAVADWPRGASARFFAALDAALAAALESAKGERGRAALEILRAEAACPKCDGARLRPEALAVTLGGLAIHELSRLPGVEALAFFGSLKFEAPVEPVAAPLVREIARRLETLDRVGLGYLALDRGADTLSGGELQRVRLAGQIGSGLVGVCFVLDEPTSGLHPRDTNRLIASLRDLRDAGNSVLVVEHDEPTIRAADWVIDLGPGAGPDGGTVVAQGPPDRLDDATGSLTARWLKREPSPLVEQPARLAGSPGAIEILGASGHNLKNVNARFPVGCLTCVAGVSGSGKSTLVLDTLARSARRHLGFGGTRPAPANAIHGLDLVTSFVDVDQSPIGRSPRSTPATFVGVFDEIRALYARTKEAKVRGYKAARFSFNAKDGRCPTCLGQGVRKIEMQFLPDLFVTCEACRGLRYNPATLEVRYRGRSIGETLMMRVDEARETFEAIPKIFRGLDALHRAGLGYVTLGQSSTTLSGGEAQRVKLANGLNRSATSGALYVLDEPTTGLHPHDVENLLRVLIDLADRGATVVVIEHNPDVARAADWLIDLGPGGGPDGGTVVATGTPAEVARDPGSVTGPFLRGESEPGKSPSGTSSQ